MAFFQHVQINGADVMALVGIALGLFFFINGFRRLCLRRQIEALATSKVRSMAVGTVEVAGTAHNFKPLKDPIYNDDCVYFSVTVSERVKHGKNESWRRVYHKNTAAFPFYLRDETGQVLVLPFGAEILGGLRIHRLTGGGFSLGGSAVDHETQFIRNVTGSSRECKLDAVILKTDFPLFLLGFAQNIPHELRGNGVALAEAAAKLKKDAARMAGVDANKDGQVDSMEWDTAVQAYKQELDATEPVRAGAALPAPPLVVVKTPRVPFVIGDNEQDVLQSLGRSTIWQTFAGPLIAAAAGAYLFQLYKG